MVKDKVFKEPLKEKVYMEPFEKRKLFDKVKDKQKKASFSSNPIMQPPVLVPLPPPFSPTPPRDTTTELSNTNLPMPAHIVSSLFQQQYLPQSNRVPMHHQPQNHQTNTLPHPSDPHQTNLLQSISSLINQHTIQTSQDMMSLKELCHVQQQKLLLMDTKYHEERRKRNETENELNCWKTGCRCSCAGNTAYQLSDNSHISTSSTKQTNMNESVSSPTITPANSNHLQSIQTTCTSQTQKSNLSKQHSNKYTTSKARKITTPTLPPHDNSSLAGHSCIYCQSFVNHNVCSTSTNSGNGVFSNKDIMNMCHKHQARYRHD